MVKPVSGFTPVIGQSQIMSVTTSSSAITLSSTTVDQQGLASVYPQNFTSGVLASQVRVYNAGPNIVNIRWGLAAKGAVTASATTDMAIEAGGIETFNKGTNIDTIAAICATGTATLYVSPGEGN